MDEILRQVIISLRGMWRYRRLGLTIAWVVGALGIAAIMLIPDKYEASARMFVNAESILKPLMAGMAVAPDINQRIELLSRVLVSRPNVERLVRNSTPKGDQVSQEDLDKQVDELIKLLKIKGGGRDQAYTITLRDPDPARAKRLVEHFTTLFIESGQGNRDVDTNVAKKFIDQQVEIYEKKLADAENLLKEFKGRYLGISPGQGGDFFARLSAAGNLLEGAKLELQEAEKSRDALISRLKSLEGSQETTEPGGTDHRAEIEARIESLKRELSVLLQKYTEAHPDVVGMRRVIADLEARKAGMPVTRKATGASAGAMGEINVALARTEANIASLRARVSEYESRQAKLRESAQLVPQLEAEFAQLNRDYDVNKRNYENLVQRRESVSLSGDMQSVSGVGDFKLIDPPHVSPRPVAPNRPLLLALALVFSLGTGAACAYGAMMMFQTFYDARGLQEATGLPVLGTIMKAGGGGLTPARKKRMFRFLAGASGLVVVYAGFIALALLNVRLPE